MNSLQVLPNEIFIKIVNNLNSKDLQRCRLVSVLLRKKVDRIFTNNVCLIFNEKSERVFVAKSKPPLLPPFIHMRIEHVSYFCNTSSKTITTKAVTLRKEYFQNITQLAIIDFVPKHYFNKILKLTGHLRILTLSSAVLGGEENLFGKDIKWSQKSGKGQMANEQKSVLFLRRSLPQPLIQNLLHQQSDNSCIINKKWSKLEKLHLKLDYLCPSTQNFSPQRLVDNLKSVLYLPVSKLASFTLTVEKSKDGETFYFTMNSLLSIIPVVAFPSLKSVCVIAEKCRPINEKERCQQGNTTDFTSLQLSDLTVKICEGGNHVIPDNLLAILKAQQAIKKVSINGIRNAHVLQLVN